MKITEVTVECGTTLPHPRYQYSSIREAVTATATLDSNESPSKVIEKLQDYLGKLLAVRLETRMKEDI